MRRVREREHLLTMRADRGGLAEMHDGGCQEPQSAMAELLRFSLGVSIAFLTTDSSRQLREKSPMNRDISAYTNEKVKKGHCL